MLDVSRRLDTRQRLEVVACGDALRQLPQVVTGQELAQLRLTDQDDLQQLLLRRLEVGEQAHLLEDRGRQVLRLVDHEYRAAAFGMRLQQVPVERIGQGLDAAPVVQHLDMQFLADCGQKLHD